MYDQTALIFIQGKLFSDQKVKLGRVFRFGQFSDFKIFYTISSVL